MMKKIRPSPKMRVARWDLLVAGKASFQPVRKRTIKSKTME
jgi:hypothetical protein